MRLVKGAYWDSEIKRGQERGLPGYPVFTRKPNTDVSYLACARIVFEQGTDALSAVRHAQCAHRRGDRGSMARKHGANSSSSACTAWARNSMPHVTDPSGLDVPCRVYAPVGEHEDLLPYLVRRLLENGSNTSFVNRIVNENEPIDAIVADPVRTVDGYDKTAHPRIPQPLDIYQPERRNSLGVHLANGTVLRRWPIAWSSVSRSAWVAAPLVGGEEQLRRRPTRSAIPRIRRRRRQR